MRHLKIYFASKRHHAEKLKGYNREGFHFISRWLDTANLPSNAVKPASQWLEENFEDIKSSDYVICYAEETHPTKGTPELLLTALVEVGWAMAYGKTVYVIGTHKSYGAWRACSSRVRMASTLEGALHEIKQLNSHPRRTINAQGKEI